MIPPADWTPPPDKQKNCVSLLPTDHPESSQFPWWFRKQIILPKASTDTNTGLKDPVHTTTSLAWKTLVDNKLKPCVTVAADADDAWQELPLADKDAPASWSTIEGKKLVYYLPLALAQLKVQLKERHDDPATNLIEIGASSIEELYASHKPATEKKDAKPYDKHLANMTADQWNIYKERKEAEYGAWGRYRSNMNFRM